MHGCTCVRACKCAHACAYTCVCMLPMHNHCPYPHLVAMFECKYLHVSDRVEKRHKRFSLETVVWVPAVGPLLSSSLSFLIWGAGVVTVLTDQSVHESAGASGGMRAGLQKLFCFFPLGISLAQWGMTASSPAPAQDPPVGPTPPIPRGSQEWPSP